MVGSEGIYRKVEVRGCLLIGQEGRIPVLFSAGMKDERSSCLFTGYMQRVIYLWWSYVL
jgi:hypothetical protein